MKLTPEQWRKIGEIVVTTVIAIASILLEKKALPR